MVYFEETENLICLVDSFVVRNTLRFVENQILAIILRMLSKCVVAARKNFCCLTSNFLAECQREFFLLTANRPFRKLLNFELCSFFFHGKRQWVLV